MTRRPPTTEMHIDLRTILSAGVLAVLLACAGTAAAMYQIPVITVDDSGGADFTSIQAAVDAASDGDTIEVRSGTYVENVDVDKRLTLVGEGADVVTVQAADSNDHVFNVTACRVNIAGFKVSGATGAGKAGIRLQAGADHCNISYNNASSNKYGIYLWSSSNNTLQDNNANNNSLGIILGRSSNNTITGNSVANNYGGIYLYSHSSNNALQNNNANNSGYNGIYLYLSNNNTLQNNIASNNCYGIYIEVSNGNTLSDNTANSNNYNGITLQSSSDNMLINNTASYSNKNYRYHGIWLYNSSNNNLTNNIANSNGYIGIYIEVSNDNTLCENTANSNNFSGICIGRLSDNNLIYHNNLIDNTNYNAYDISTNQWDSGTEGNYYSDYTGTDSDGDGIGDTPYPIPGGSSVDRYPLMAPYSPTPLPFPRFIDNNDGTVTDQLTGLMWTKITDYPNRNLNWYEALNYVSDMNQGIINNFGYHDWRLPNVEEFEDIADPRNIAPGLPTGHPFIIRSYGGQWSSSTVVDNPNRAYMFSLYHGTISSNGKLMGGALVWPVRGGLSVPPTTDIILISPNGGENWQAGTTQTIQWSYSGNPGSNVKIELLKGGVVDSIITSSTPMGSADSGSFNWEIPSTQTPGTDYQIKITSTSDTAYTDISDCFSISADPAISSTFGSSDQNVLLSPEPINVGTGSYIYQHHDMSISGRGLPLTITRSYNSMDIYSGPLGSGWTFNYNVNLVVGSEDVVVMREDGRRDIYSSNPDGTYSPPLNVYDTLDKNPDNTFTLTRKDKVEYNFSPQGKLNNIIDKNNNQISLTYTGDYLIKVTDASGKELIFTYDVAGRIIAITGHVGRTWSYTYDDESNLIRYTNPMGGQFSYTYDENHWMTSITDPRGNQIMTNTYDGEGRVISQSNALGAIYTFSYDVENRETTEIDPLGGTKIYAYDEHFWGLSETDQLGNTIYYAYDEDGNRISVTNANGQTTQFAYDANGDIIQITDPLGYITSMTYDSKDNLISVTDALGRQIFLEYDANSNLVGAINALGDDTHFTYDEHGQLISGTDANGHTANFGYDADGNQIAVTDALGNTVAFTYDSVCRLITTTDANGNTYTLLYDNLDRLVSVTDPLGYTASNTYDPVGNRISFTDPAGSLTSYSYDPLNQLTEVTDAMGGTVHYNYDIIGNMISMTDANGHTTNYAYDPLNHPISISDPLGYTTSNTYDAVGNRIGLTDATGSITSYSYDPLNRLVAVTDAMGGSVYYTYDAVGNMISMTDANGHTTNYAYDPLNHPISISDPLGYTTSNTYDAVGNTVSLTDANGKTTSYSYDGLNRLIEIAYPDDQTVGYSYDAMGNRLMMTDSHGTTNYEYDNLNRLISVINPDSQTVGYMYDIVGNRIQITYPDGKTITYGYDANNRLTSVTDWDGHITGYSYDANSNLIGMTYPNSRSTEYLYDENNQLIELINENSTQVISSFEYTLDAAGNRLSVAEWFSDRFESESGIPQVLTTSYEYDDIYRLTQVNYPFEEIVSYNYDPMGNRISMTTTVDGIDTTINYAYDAADRLLLSGGITYDYDNNGNMVRKTETPGRVTSYNYDGANRLISLSKMFDGSQQDIYTFEYDGDGNRLSKATINGKKSKSSEYLWDVNTILPQVLTESDKKGTTFYAIGLDLISMSDPRGKEFYYHYDGLGSVCSLSDSKESIKAIYSYDAFGQTRKEMGHVDNDFRFTGEQMDDETGLIYLRARYYDPDTGRFINKDPIQGIGTMTQSINRYVYSMNNPVNLVDPSGYCGETPDIIDFGGMFSIGLEIAKPIGEWTILQAARLSGPETWTRFGFNQYADDLTKFKSGAKTLGTAMGVVTLGDQIKKDFNRQGITSWNDINDIIRDIPNTEFRWDSVAYGFSSTGATAANSLAEIYLVNPILRWGGQETFTFTATNEGPWSISAPPVKEWIMSWSNRW